MWTLLLIHIFVKSTYLATLFFLVYKGPGRVFWQKKKCRQSRDTVPLMGRDTDDSCENIIGFLDCRCHIFLTTFINFANNLRMHCDILDNFQIPRQELGSFILPLLYFNSILSDLSTFSCVSFWEAALLVSQWPLDLHLLVSVRGCPSCEPVAFRPPPVGLSERLPFLWASGL